MNILIVFLQFTWGILQTLLGAAVFLLYRKKEHFRYRGSLVTRWGRDDSLSLGFFLFLGEGAGERVLRHEYGHSLQSAILGPLYLLLVGIPSSCWCNVPPMGRSWRSGKRSYYAFYTERWADRMGRVKEIFRAGETSTESESEEYGDL